MQQLIEAVAGGLIGERLGSSSMRVLRLILSASCVAFATVGVALLVLGPAPDLVLGIGAIALALLMLGALVILGDPPGKIVARTIAVDGTGRPAFVAEMSRRKSGIAGAILAVVAIGLGVLAVLGVGDAPDQWWAALLIAGVAVLAALGALNGLLVAVRGGHLALLPEGVRVRGGLDSSFVPWTAVTAVGTDDSDLRRRHAFVRYADDPGLRLGPVARLMRLPARRAPGELRFDRNRLRVAHDELAHVVAYFYADPQQRTRIGSSEALAEVLAAFNCGTTPVTPRDARGLPHADTELETRLPRTILGEPTTAFSEAVADLDEYSRYWLGGVAESLGCSMQDLTVAFAGHESSEYAVRAYRFHGVLPRALQGALDADMWTDRTLSGGGNTRHIGGVRLSRGIAGERNLAVSADGMITESRPAPPDPLQIHHDLVRGDTWFQIFASDDLDWISDAVLGVAGPLPTSQGLPAIKLPQGWVGRDATPDGLAELGREVDAAVGEVAGTGSESWAALTRRLTAADDEGFLAGTRYVACDLDRGRLGPAPAGMEVWEYLAPYLTLEEEVEATRSAIARDGADVTATVTGTPGSSIGEVDFRLRSEDMDTLGAVRFLRLGGVAYQLLMSAGGENRDTARSVLDAAVSSMTGKRTARRLGGHETCDPTAHSPDECNPG